MGEPSAHPLYAVAGIYVRNRAVSYSGSYSCAPALNQMVAVMISWAQSFNAVTAAIFGKQELQAKSSAAAIGGIADASSSAASGQDKLASSTKKAAKEAKSALAPYDELHIIQSNKVTETDGQSAINPTVDGGTSYQGMSGEIGSNVKLSPEFEAVINKLKSIDLTPAKESLDNFFEAVKKFAEPVGEGLKWFFDNVLLPLAKWIVKRLFLHSSIYFQLRSEYLLRFWKRQKVF